MLDSISSAVSLLALISGSAAAWYLVPRPGPFAAERTFKGLLVGALVQRGSEALAARRLVPYHPACGQPDHLLDQPEIERVPGASSDDLRALYAQLSALPDRASRWRVWFDDPAGDVIVDTLEAGSDLDLARWFGPSFRVGLQTEALDAAMAQRALHWRWLIGADARGLDGADVSQRLAALLPVTGDAMSALSGLHRVISTLDTASPMVWEAVAAWGAAWSYVAMHDLVEATKRWLASTRPEKPGERVVVVGTDAAMPVLLRALHDDLDLRDAVAAVVSIGGNIQGAAAEWGAWSESVASDWLARNFRHAALDTEVIQLTPYLSLVYADPQSPGELGARGIRAGAQRFPEPGFDGREPPFLDCHDLGMLEERSDMDASAVRDALRVVVALRIVQTRGT